MLCKEKSGSTFPGFKLFQGGMIAEYGAFLLVYLTTFTQDFSVAKAAPNMQGLEQGERFQENEG